MIQAERAHLKAVRSREAQSKVAAEARPEATSWPTAGSMVQSGARRLGCASSSPNRLKPSAQEACTSIDESLQQLVNQHLERCAQDLNSRLTIVALKAPAPMFFKRLECCVPGKRALETLKR